MGNSSTREVTNLLQLIGNLEKIVHDTDMKNHRWGLWDGCRQAVEYLKFMKEVYVVCTEPGPHQEFVEVENEWGESLAVAEWSPYPGTPTLWRLGPFLASPKEPAATAASGALDRGTEKDAKDDPNGEGGSNAAPGSGRVSWD